MPLFVQSVHQRGLTLDLFHAVTIKACLMPNIEFYFPSAGLSALSELLAVE